MKFLDIFFLFRLFSVLVYFMLASQGGFYLLSFHKVLQNLPSKNFIEIRKSIDHVIEAPLKILYPGGFLMMLIWLLITDRTPDVLGYGLLTLSFLLLATDLALAVSVSNPLNRTIHNVVAQSGGQAIRIQKKWLKFIFIRGCLSISGFIFLILHMMIRMEMHHP